MLEDRIDLGKLGRLSPAYQDLAWKLLLAEGEISKTGKRNQMRPDVYELRAFLKGDASEMYELPRPECFGIGASDATDPACANCLALRECAHSHRRTTDDAANELWRLVAQRIERDVHAAGRT